MTIEYSEILTVNYREDAQSVSLTDPQSVQLANPSQRRVAHGLFQRPERRQVFGRAPGDEARAVAVSSDVDRQGPDEAGGQPFQQFRREPGEPRAGRQGKQAGGAEAEDGDDVDRRADSTLIGALIC